MSTPNNKAAAPKAQGVKIVQKGKLFWVSLNVGQLSYYYQQNSQLRSLVIWLSTLTEDETLRISFHGYCEGFMDIEVYLPLMGAIESTKAKTIGIVDHIMDDIRTYIALTCDALEVSDYGQLVFTSPWRVGETSMRSDAVNAYANTLLQGACKVRLLEDHEYRMIRSGEIVYLSPDTLKTRISKDV